MDQLESLKAQISGLTKFVSGHNNWKLVSRCLQSNCPVCAEKSKLNPHVEKMKQCLANIMGLDIDCVSIKATTTEKLGFTGRMEGISAYCVALISKNEE